MTRQPIYSFRANVAVGLAIATMAGGILMISALGVWP